MIDYKFTRLNRKQFNTLVEWAELEGWNPGPYDAGIFWETDPEGFYGYIKNNELIAGGSIVSYNGQFGFMGFFIVKPEYRSKGLGRKLWYLRRDTLLSRLNDGASIGMDGVVDMQPFYGKGGFEIAFRDIRMESRGKKFDAAPPVREFTDADTADVLKMDEECFGFKRDKFMKAWLKIPEGKSFVHNTNNETNGFAVLRRAKTGYKIGPLFANDFNTAEELLKACFSSATDQPVYLDIPMINTDALKLAEKFGMNPVFECARMYYGPQPEVSVNKIFGITSFELG